MKADTAGQRLVGLAAQDRLAGLMKRLVPNGAQALTLGEYLVNQTEDQVRPEPAENG